MTLKNWAFLAFLGTLLLTILVTADFVRTVLAIARGLIPALAFIRGLIYVFASLTVTIFFCAFQKAQSR